MSKLEINFIYIIFSTLSFGIGNKNKTLITLKALKCFSYLYSEGTFV